MAINKISLLSYHSNDFAKHISYCFLMNFRWLMQEGKRRNGERKQNTNIETFSYPFMRKFCYGLQFSAVINSFRPLYSLPYLFDGPIFFFAIFCNQLFQPYSSKRTSTKIVPSYPTLFLFHPSLMRSNSRDIVDVLRISSTECGLKFRVPDQVRDWRHRDCMTSPYLLNKVLNHRTRYGRQ
jgi:hypothetical protein